MLEEFYCTSVNVSSICLISALFDAPLESSSAAEALVKMVTELQWCLKKEERLMIMLG